jgi:hypothetical protein
MTLNRQLPKITQGGNPMTAKELQKRNNKAEHLRVLQTEDGGYYVESSEGKILYNVTFTDDFTGCTCGDWARNSKKDPDFRCKHILAVFNCVPLGDVESAQFLDKRTPKLDDRFIIDIEGSQFVKYAGLLDLGHQKGISQIEVEPLQLPTKDNGNFAICRATIVSKVGESFTDIGDANPTNCNVKVGKHLLRLASTRAIARALRTFTNIGYTCLEELADLNEVIGDNKGKGKSRTPKKAASTAKASTKKTNTKPKTSPKAGKSDKSDGSKSKGNGNGKDKAAASKKSANTTQPKMSEAQKRAIYNLSRRRGISVEDLEQMAMDAYGLEVENLSSKDASSFIRNLQQAA